MNRIDNPNERSNKRILVSGGRVAGFIVAIGLLYSGLIHYQNQFFFYESVLRYDLFNPDIAAYASVWITTVSMVIGVALLLPTLRSAASMISICLFAAFTLAQISAWLRGVQAGCGCFGISSTQIGLHSILTAVLFLVLSVYCFWVEAILMKRRRPNVF
ncbi:MAG: putative membrane protein [Mariniblastus sp.]